MEAFPEQPIEGANVSFPHKRLLFLIKKAGNTCQLSGGIYVQTGFVLFDLTKEIRQLN